MAIIVVGGISAFFLLSGNNAGEESYPSVGDSITYRASGFVPSKGSFEGPVEIRITSVSENSYTFKEIPKGNLSAADQDRGTWKKNEPIADPQTFGEAEFIGKENVVTDIGTIETDYYRLENQTEGGLENKEFYLENETGITIKVSAESPNGMRMNMILVSTNIDALKEKFE
ncbi:hypothetical protein AKJ37_06390 [candidate division MSBL1 archaeon SCGC-AAA259I09]|uniref:Uncharacterized protein n=1 Tax=candidate division MSBL1 archaeon SCGC-AAA259I09 TaxID=1698267 RepID=A0A133UP29_9EURY|nr:hypothetical protein AKJ37_06390 [candidate division MSBL1 archaeon SCGC-AAA259I09]